MSIRPVRHVAVAVIMVAFAILGSVLGASWEGGLDSVRAQAAASTVTPDPLVFSGTEDNGPIDVNVTIRLPSPPSAFLDRLAFGPAFLGLGDYSLPQPSNYFTSGRIEVLLRFTPKANASGTATVPSTFYIYLTDGSVQTAQVDATVNLAPVNDPPTISGPNPISVTTAEDTPVDVTIPGTDVDGDTLTYTLTSGPSHGQLSPGTGATRTYTPDPNYHGPDSYSVLVSDGHGGSVVVVVNINVTPQNDPPVIAGGNTTLSYTVNERRSGQSSITIPLSLALSDPDGDPLSLETTAPIDQHGRLISFLPGPNTYSTSYVPENGYVGSDQYGVLVSDGNGGTLTLLINVTVQNTNDTPRPAADMLAASPENTVRSIPFSDLTANDNPGANDAAAGDTLTVVLVGQPVGGTVRIVGQTVEFTPTTGFTGTASFVYTVQDQGFARATATASFTVLAVNDPPVITPGSIPGPVTATTDTGATATATWTTPTATDPDSTAAGQATTVTCTALLGDGISPTPVVSGETAFPVGTTTVTCTATDVVPAGTQPLATPVVATFTVTVTDTGAPQVVPSTLPGTANQPLLVEATGPDGAIVTYTPPTFTDNVTPSDAITVSCDTPSGTLVPIGLRIVTCTAQDAAGNQGLGAFPVLVQDTTAPTLTVPANITVEATSSAGTVVPYIATATDVVDGPVTPVCTPASGSTFPIGKTTVTCTATDAAGNVATGSFTVTVGDSTGPVITWVGGPQPGKTYTQGTLPAEPTCTATDTSSPVTECRVYGYSTAPGTHTLTARARDSEGNASVSTRTYTVTASAPTATPRPATATPRPATATPRPATATPTRPTRPTVTPVPPTVTPLPPTATPVTPVVQPTTAPTRPPRR